MSRRNRRGSTTAGSPAIRNPHCHAHEYGTKATVAQANSRHPEPEPACTGTTDVQVTRAIELGHSQRRRAGRLCRGNGRFPNTGMTSDLIKIITSDNGSQRC